jgi:hypothetical protein
MRQAHKRKEIYSAFWKNNLEERVHLPDLSGNVDGATILTFWHRNLAFKF